jgi:hypothetical protein
MSECNCYQSPTALLKLEKRTSEEHEAMVCLSFILSLELRLPEVDVRMVQAEVSIFPRFDLL